MTPAKAVAQLMAEVLMSADDADRVGIARALVPPGWVVARMPDCLPNPEIEWRQGWNACIAALRAQEETP